ncbi:MAG: hypothetical protein AB7V18_16165 [Pyrinomonadaceae bacterium]
MFEIFEQYDIRGYSFEQFVVFLFDHEVPPEFASNGKRMDPWYYKAEVKCMPIDVIAFYTQLFSEPNFLLDRFSKDKLEQGFWAIMGQSLECSVGEVIWSDEVEFVERANCVRSMFHLYERLFSIDSLVTSSNMWWDSLAYDWHCGNRNRKNGGEDLLMQDVMFETLEMILKLPSIDCQFAALHGLGHLHHPNTASLVLSYLKRKPHKSLELREYANAAARFEVL